MKAYRITISDVQAVIDFYERIAWRLFDDWQPDDWGGELPESRIAWYRALLENGRVQMEYRGWPECPICIAVGLGDTDGGRVACDICPVDAECWRNPDGAYNRTIEALDAYDPAVIYLALYDSYCVLEALRDTIQANGGYLEVYDAKRDV